MNKVVRLGPGTDSPHMADLVQGEDGYYVFWPRERGGWTESEIQSIYQEMSLLNRGVDNYYREQAENGMSEGSLECPDLEEEELPSEP